MSGRPIPPPPSRAPLPVAPVSVAGLDLQDPIRRVDGHLTYRLDFVRAPGIGELIGYLPKCTPSELETAIQQLIMDPAWVVHVLQRCASLGKSDAESISLRDWPRVVEVVAGFFGGSPGTGG